MIKITKASGSEEYPNRRHVLDFAKKVFLPSGYPESVSPGMSYQYFLSLARDLFSGRSIRLSSVGYLLESLCGPR
jgi:hypothetical protein